MSTAITPNTQFRPVAREAVDVARPFVSVWISPDVCIQVDLTPEGREWLHCLADAARFAALTHEAAGAGQ
jgi:hypothetical protein